MKILFATLNLILLFNTAHVRSDGASSADCDILTPSHGNSSAQNGSSNFSLTLEGSNTTYVPGQQYSRKTINIIFDIIFCLMILFFLTSGMLNVDRDYRN